MNRQFDPIDLHVAQRLKLRRSLLGFTQDRLAQAVGVSFQMVQKYEKGESRVGASRLMKIAEALDVPVSWFFEGCRPVNLAVAEETPAFDEDVLSRRETTDVLKAYYALPESMRKHVLGMMKGLAGGMSQADDEGDLALVDIDTEPQIDRS
jgi:transcriptional regulator with XRE-family HTH domain